MRSPSSFRPRTRAFTACLALTLGATTFATACSSPSNSDSSAEEPAIAATVHISDGEFDPRDVEIEPGGSVLWINDDVTDHSLTFLDSTLRSGRIKATRTWVHTFAEPGEYRYYDDIHNTMKATVVVRPPS